MRRTLACSLALLLAGLLAGCGKSALTTTVGKAPTSRGGSRSGGSSSGSPGGAGSAAARARALGFARAVNLTATDLPGFTAAAPQDSSSARERQLERQMLSCAGLAGAAAKSVAEQSSKTFRYKQQLVDLSVSSEVSVAASAAEAARSLKALQSAHIRSCFSEYLTHVLKGEHVSGATPGRVTIQSGTPPAPGMTGSFGWRVTARYIVRGVQLPIYLDFLGFVDGPSEVTLLSSGLLRPFPAEAEQHLFTLLLARARKHMP